MTKEQFLNYKKEETYCETCKRMLPTRNFMYSYMRLDGTALQCRYCAWIRRHGGIPDVEGHDLQIVQTALEFLLLGESVYINDLAKLIGYSLPDTIKLIQSLHVGNKTCVVKSNCEYCGKEIENTMSVYMNTKNLYCNLDCYWRHKPQTVGHGKENATYKRIATKCTNCGKDIDIIPYNYNLKNTYGDNHNFCSQQCYWEYRSKYYVGEKSVGANRIITDKQRERMRLTVLENCRKSSRFDSKIQLSINNILDRHNIIYEREYIIGYYAVDNYLVDSGLIIEIMGDYWHTSPLKYNDQRYMINEMQQKGLQHDKQKHTYIKKHNAVEILYLWENNIENNIEMCEALIFKYINSNGVLDNYHSFNWSWEENNLVLNNDIIIPYQDMKTEQYKHLIKKKVG